jgi:glycine cleavage system H protein
MVRDDETILRHESGRAARNAKCRETRTLEPRVIGSEAVRQREVLLPQDSLGDVVYVQLPDAGVDVIAGASISEIESTKSVSDVYAPLTGLVLAVNDALTEKPELVNQDPYGNGWMFEIEMNDAAEAEKLMDAAAYRALVEG